MNLHTQPSRGPEVDPGGLVPAGLFPHGARVSRPDRPGGPLGARRPGHGPRGRPARRRQRRTEHRGPPWRRPLRQEPPDPSPADQPAAPDRLAARLPPQDGGVREALRRGPAERRAGCRLSQPARRPLRVDAHLADRRPVDPRPDRVDRPGHRPALPASGSTDAPAAFVGQIRQPFALNAARAIVPTFRSLEDCVLHGPARLRTGRRPPAGRRGRGPARQWTVP